jgi:hypothetical protein
MRRELLYGLSAALLLVSLTACGNPQADQPNEPAPTPSATQTAPPSIEPSKTVPIQGTDTPTEAVTPEPRPIVEEGAEPTLEGASGEDISAFAGVYAMYDQPLFNAYGYPATIALEDNGRISGQILSGKTPIYITQNINGTLTCMISEGEQKFDETANMLITTQPREFYVICPAGVTSGFDSYPDYDYLGTDTARIRYVMIDGGVLDIMYYKTG